MIKKSLIALAFVVFLASLYILADFTNKWYLSTKAHKHVGWVIIYDNGGIEIEKNQ